MIRTKLLTATAVAAILAAPAAFAQDAQPELPPPPVADETTQDMPTTPEGAPTAAPSEEMAPAQPTEMQTAEATPAAGDSIIGVLRAQGEFTTLLEALDSAQLTQVIEQDPDITIFAPTDAAFAALPAEELARLTDPANAQELRQLLLYHVINADVRSEQLEGARGGVPTASGAEVLLDGSQGAIRADAATVTQADLRGSNGAVFVIDQVLTPGDSMASMGDSEGLTATDEEADATMMDEQPPADTTAPAQPVGEEDETVTAPDRSPATSVETVASQPVPNPADTPADQQPTTDDAAPMPAEPATPDTMGAPVDPTTGAVPPGAPGAPEGAPTASDPTAAPPVVTSPPVDDDADASDDEDPTAPDQPTA